MAEVAGLVLAIPGLIQTCLLGYQAFSSALLLAREGRILYLQLRIQEQRLLVMSKGLGLDVDSFSGEADTPQMAKEMATLVPSRIKSEATLSLTCEILAEMSQLLTDKEKLMARYGLEPVSNMAQQSQTGGLRRLRWTIRDKERVSKLVFDLKELNDGLERQFTVAERADMAAMLPVQVSSASTSDELSELKEAAARYESLSQALDLQAFSVSLEANPAQARTLRLDADDMGRLTGLEDTSREIGTLKRRDLQKYPRGFEHVVVEWKEYQSRPGSSYDALRGQLLRARIESLAKLLHQASSFKNLRVLHCVGYLDDRAHSRTGCVLSLEPDVQGGVGGQGEDGDVVPRSLRSLVGASKAMPALGQRFELATALCRTVLQLHSVGWLHKGLRSDNVWFLGPGGIGVGVGVGSPDDCSAGLDMTQPWLVGFEYARPDGDYEMTETLTSYSWEQDLYRHPESLQHFGMGNPVTGRYRRAYDVYSLGCILLEIGLWKRLEELWKPRYQKERGLFRERLIGVWAKELDARCGLIYADVVRGCLTGLYNEEDDPEGGGRSTQDGGTAPRDLDLFFRRVLCRLQMCHA